MSRRRRGRVKTRRPKVIDAALGATIFWGAMAMLFFAGGGFGQANPTYFLLFGGLTILAWGWALLTIHAQQAAGKTLEQLQALAPDIFQDWVAARFRELGYKVKATGAGAEHGVDLIAEQPGEIAVVQCKNYKLWAVGEPVVRDLFGAMHHFGANQAYLVTSGRVTTAASEWAKDKPIEIWDGERLALLSQHLARRNAKQAEDDTQLWYDLPRGSISAFDKS